MSPKHLLVTGASGFIGWNLCTHALRQGWRVTGVVHRHEVVPPAVAMVRFDFADTAAIDGLIERVDPEAVVHLAAVSQPNDCEREPERSRVINVEAPWRLATACAQRAVPLVFTSTDLVFDGQHAPYGPDDPVGPINAYGRQKAHAEQLVRRAGGGAVVCRMPLMYGEPGPVATSFIQPWIRALRCGERLRLFVDEYRTPVSGRCAAEGLLRAVEQPALRYHLGGHERISRYEFGCRLARLLGVDERLIEPISQRDIQMAAARPADVSLASSRAYHDLGFAPPSIESELRRLV